MGKRSPIPTLILGIVALMVGIAASMVEITASEAWMLGLQYVSFKPSYHILLQPIDMITGALPSNEYPGALFAWSIEVLFLIAVYGYEIANNGIKHHNPALAGWLRFGIGMAIVFDFYTNVVYSVGLANGFIGQVMFAFAMVLVVMLFTLVGFYLLQHSLQMMHMPGSSGGSPAAGAKPVVVGGHP